MGVMTYAVRARVGAVLACLAVMVVGSGEAAAKSSTTRSVAKLQKEIKTLRGQLAAVQRQLASVAAVTGPAGAKGAAGAAGTLGATGATGPAGPKGEKGDPGAPAPATDLAAYARLDAAQTFTAAQHVSNVFSISPVGVTSPSPSVGGALNIDNTGATGAGAVIYSNAGAEAAGRLLNVRVDNPAFPTAAAQVASAGTGNGLEVVSTSTGTSSNAFSVVSTNPNDTAVGIRGAETGRGTVKITHSGTGNDANASAISLLLSGSGTAAQGIFLDAPGAGTTGRLLNFRNGGVPQITASADGVLYARGGLAVGNSQPAGAISGAVVRKVEIFDAAGRSLGFIPVYAGID